MNVEAGFGQALGFDFLPADSTSFKGACYVALLECSVDPPTCQSISPSGEYWSNVKGFLDRYEPLAERSFRKVARVAADEFLGFDAFQPAARSLAEISAGIAAVGAAGRAWRPCREVQPTYCSLFRRASSLESDAALAARQIADIRGHPFFTFCGQNIAYSLVLLHALPHFVTLVLLVETLEYGPSRRLRVLCSQRYSRRLVVWVLFFAGSTMLTLASVDVAFGLGILPCLFLDAKPPITDFLDALRESFPQFWETLLGSWDGYGLWVVSAGLAFEAACVLAAARGVQAWLHYLRIRKRPVKKTSVGPKKECSLPREELAVDDTWQKAPREELYELSRLRPCQWTALQHVRSRCKALHTQALPHLRARALKLGFSEAELGAALAWIRETAAIIVHVDLVKFAALLANDTHYRNQFETHCSGGTLDVHKRVLWEDELFAGAYRHAAPSERCKHGVLNVVNDPQGVRSCRQYGTSYLLLKGVRMRTTLAATDTAGLKTDDLATVDFYGHILNKYTDKELTSVIKVANKQSFGVHSGILQSYKEAQIHGELRLADNVDLIVVHPSVAHAPGMSESLRWLSKTCGAEVVWMDGGEGSNAVSAAMSESLSLSAVVAPCPVSPVGPPGAVPILSEDLDDCKRSPSP